MSDNRGWVYDDNGTIVYRASSLGSCTRSLVAARLGESQFPFNASIRAAMDESSDAEEKAIHAYRVMTGHDVIWQQKEVELNIKIDLDLTQTTVGSYDIPVIVRGHIDGLDQTDDCIIEVKCFSGRNFAAYDMDGLGAPALKHLRRRYKLQAAVYGHATERPVRFVIYNKHAEGEEDRLIIGPMTDPGMYESITAIQSHIQFIEQCAEMDDLPPCDADCKEGDPYSEAHIFASPTDGGDELEKLLSRHRELSAQMDELKIAKEELTDVIKSVYGVGKHVAGRYTASISHVTSMRCDTKKVKKRYPEVYDDCLVESSTVRMVVTESGQGKVEESDV